MTSQQILDIAIESGVFLYVEGGGLKYRAPAGNMSPELRQLLKQHRQEIILHLNKMQVQAVGDRFEPPPIQRRIGSGRVPLSYAQQRFWFIEQLENCGIHMRSAHRLTGSLNVRALEDALNTIVNRHESLRTVFFEENGTPYQFVVPTVKFGLTRTDLCSLSESEQESEIRRHIAEDAQRPFDLARDLMIRVHLLALSPEVHVVILNQHHIASDAWSQWVFRRELVELYLAYCEGRPNLTVPLKLQYADYTVWQQAWLKGEVLERQLAFWKRALKGIPEVHNLPLDHGRTTGTTHSGGSVVCTIDDETLQGIRDFCNRRDATLFMFFHTAMSILLSRYSDDTDIVVGTPVLGRVHPDLEAMIGLFVNTVVLRLRLDGDPSFEELLKQEKQQLLDALNHQHVPFELVVETMKPRRSTSYNPIFQVLFNMQPLDTDGFALPGLKYEALGVAGIGTFDLSITVMESVHSLSIRFSYSSAVFLGATVTRMANNFRALLSSILDSPSRRVRELDMLAPMERNRLVTELNQGRSTPVCIVDSTGNLMPEGGHGELCVPATGLAQYCNDQDPRDVQRQMRSIPNPLASASDEPLWRTGALARWSPTGELELFGALADRTTVGGVRINLARFRGALSTTPWIIRFAVVVREDVSGCEILVAYVAGDKKALAPFEHFVTELRISLASALDGQEVRFALAVVDRLPFFIEGGLQLDLLPIPEDAIKPSELFEGDARTDTELRMERIWRTVLPDSPLSNVDNFFAVGGHSLSMIVLIKRISMEFGVDIPLATFMEAPTIKATSRFVSGAPTSGNATDVRRPMNQAPLEVTESVATRQNSIPPLSLAERSKPLALSFVQRGLLLRMWSAKSESGRTRFNMPDSRQIVGPLCIESLRRTFETIVARHAILRTVYREESGEPVQVILAPTPFSIPFIDLSGLALDVQTASVGKHVRDHALRPFDLASEPSLRVLLLKLSDQRHVCLINIHHIATDGFSFTVFIREVNVIYTAYIKGRPHSLPELPIQYCDYAVWQRESFARGLFNADMKFWRQRLSDLASVPGLPLDKPRPLVESLNGAYHRTIVNAELVRRLSELSRSQNGTLFMILHAIFALLLHGYSGADDVIIGAPVANRHHRDVESVIGCFTNNLVLRSEFKQNPSFVDFLAQTIDNVQQAFIHQSVPFGLLLEAAKQLNPERDLNQFPLCQAIFTFQNSVEREAIDLPDLKITPLDTMEILDTHNPFVLVDLVLDAVQTSGGLSLQWQYATDILSKGTVELLADRFDALLESVLRWPEERVNTLYFTASNAAQQLT